MKKTIEPFFLSLMFPRLLKTFNVKRSIQVIKKWLKFSPQQYLILNNFIKNYSPKKAEVCFHDFFSYCFLIAPRTNYDIILIVGCSPIRCSRFYFVIKKKSLSTEERKQDWGKITYDARINYQKKDNIFDIAYDPHMKIEKEKFSNVANNLVAMVHP